MEADFRAGGERSRILPTYGEKRRPSNNPLQNQAVGERPRQSECSHIGALQLGRVGDAKLKGGCKGRTRVTKGHAASMGDAWDEK
jgi:hypothetical protein